LCTYNIKKLTFINGNVDINVQEVRHGKYRYIGNESDFDKIIEQIKVIEKHRMDIEPTCVSVGLGEPTSHLVGFGEPIYTT
jgi:hypothetical protein